MIEINLLPVELIVKRKKRDFVIFVGICGVVAALICYILYLSLYQTIQPLEKRLLDLKAEIAKSQPVLKEIQKAKKENSELKNYLLSLRKVVIRQSFYPRVMYDIYLCLPDTVWLRQIKKGNTDNFLEIEGASLNQTVGIAEFMRNLMKKSNLFSKINFTKFSTQKIFGRQVMLFQLRCILSKKIRE